MAKSLFPLLLACMTAGSCEAAAQPLAAEPTLHAQVKARYCEKLRESPEAYVQFVRRLKPIHGYTYTDFAPERAGDAVKADCGVGHRRIAAVHALLGGDVLAAH
jgi:hypothetical protein